MTEEKKTSTDAEVVTDKEKTNVSDEKNAMSDKEVKKEDKKSSCGGGACGGEKNGGIFVWIIVIVIIVGVIIFITQKNDDKEKEDKEVNEKVSTEISELTMKIIEEDMGVPSNVDVKIEKIVEGSDIYKIDILIDGQELQSGLTKDKKIFIPQFIDLAELDDIKKQAEEGAPKTEVQVKSDKPEVELYIMSHCPYGTQMEKGILPVLDALGDTIDMKWKFVDYAMHGELEVKEQMRQYCIQESVPNKFNDYLECFLAGTSGSETEAKACMTKLQINNAVVAQCEKALDAEHNILALLEDKSSYISGQFPQFNVHKEENEKYGVQGSPTLVINGEEIQSGRDSASILATICSGFEEQPEACQAELSSTSPAPGFGEGEDTTGTSDDAGCGA